MKHEIRQSDNKKFYYLLSIDDENNQTVLAQSEDLKELQSHKSVKGKNLKPIPEAETRGIIKPPVEDEDSET